MEGLLTAGNIQGSPADTLVGNFKARSIDEVLKWVDYFVFLSHSDQPAWFIPLPPPSNMAMIVNNTIYHWAH